MPSTWQGAIIARQAASARPTFKRVIIKKQMDERSATGSNVEISLTADEALVLFECLSRLTGSGALSIVDQAEERALWNLCALFQKTVL